MQKRSEMQAGWYFVQFADRDDPNGAQEYHVNKKGESERYRHNVGGNSTATPENISADTLVIRIRS